MPPTATRLPERFPVGSKYVVEIQTMSVVPSVVPTGHVSERPEDSLVIYAEDTSAPEVASSLPLLMSTNCSRDSA
jgi:hypothetical protein